MKNLFSFMLLILLGLIIAFGFTTKEASTIESQPQISPKEKVSAISTINKIIVEETAQNGGLCDTCHTSYKAAIIENRMIANQISAQNYKMSEVIQLNEIEISRLESTAGMLVKLRKKYEFDIANIEKRVQNNKVFYAHAQLHN